MKPVVRVTTASLADPARRCWQALAPKGKAKPIAANASLCVGQRADLARYRARILELLRDGPQTISALAAALHCSRKTIDAAVLHWAEVEVSRTPAKRRMQAHVVRLRVGLEGSFADRRSEGSGTPGKGIP